MSVPWHDDFKRAGYRSFQDGFKPKSGEYQGSWQKRFRDSRGTRYFITASLWLWGDRRSVQPDVQFNLDDADRTAINVTWVGRGSIEEFEAFFARTWNDLRLGWYEVDYPDVPDARPSPTSPVLRSPDPEGES